MRSSSSVRPPSRAAAVFVGLIASLFALLVLAVPVIAADRGSLAVAEGRPQTRDLPASTTTDPSRPSVQAAPTPPGCKTSSSCDHVLLQITPPSNVKASDEWFVTIELSWQPQVVNGTDTVDQDLYLYDTTAVVGVKPLVQSASSDNPERVRIFVPPKREYSLVINTAGRPSPYKLSASMRVDRITAPSESRDPTGPPPSPSDGSGPGSGSTASRPSSAPPAAGAGEPPSSIAFAADGSPTAPPTTAFEYTPLPGDPELQAIAGEQLESVLQSGRDLLAEDESETAIAPARKVGAGVAVLWLGVIPALLAVALTVVLVRRQPKALRPTT